MSNGQASEEDGDDGELHFGCLGEDLDLLCGFVVVIGTNGREY